MEYSEAIEYVKNLNVRRKRQVQYGWGMVALGLLIYLDAGWRFPVPLTGPWAFMLGTPLILAGFWFVIASKKLPIREALLFASTRRGKVTAPSLSVALDVTLDTAEMILEHLVQKGYAQVSTEEMEEGVIVYKISGIETLELPDGN